MTNDLWDVKAREKEEEDRLRTEIKGIEGGLALIKASAAMRTATGYRDFVSAITSMRDIARSLLVSSDRLTDAGLRESRGRVRALNEVLGLLESDRAPQVLEDRLKAVQNELEAAMVRRPIKREEST